MPITICSHCGKQLIRQKNRLNVKNSFCDRKCKGKWMTGKYTTENPSNKYRVIKRNKKNIKEHRLVVEKFINRPLKRIEHVHHINGDKLDNRIENLEIIESGAHISLHHRKQLDEEKIINMRKNGYTCASIAFEFKVSRGAIVRRLKENDINHSNRFTKWNVEEAIKMLDGGLNREQVAKAFNITRSTLQKRLNKLGLAYSDSRYKINYDIDEIKKRLENNESIRSIATSLGVSYSGFRKNIVSRKII